MLRRVGTPYGGYGYIGLPVGVGIDLGGAHGIFSHELGHNFGRFHAPCGDPAGVDQNDPHAGARTGFWGFDLNGHVHHAPTQPDLMSYCGSPWFRGDLVGQGDGDRHFAFAIPTRLADPEQLAELRLVAAGEEIRTRAARLQLDASDGVGSRPLPLRSIE